MSARTGLWAHRDFLRLWSAQAISAFGSRITRTALPIIAVQTLGVPEGVFAILAALQLAPGVVLALFVGGFVDRSRKRRILVAADLFRAAVVASITIAWAAGIMSIFQVILVGALVGAASSLFQITDVAYLPSLIGKRRLGEGNAKLETTEAVAEITGPASAGLLIALLGAPLAMIVNTASYLWSAIMLGRIRTAEAVPEPDAAARDDTNASRGWQSKKDLRIGMRAVFGDALVRPIVLALMVWSIAGGFFNALYVPLCFRVLDLSYTSYGIIVALGGVGSLLGAMASRPLARAIGVGPTMIAGSAASTLGSLFMPLAAEVASRPTALAFLGLHQLISDGFAVVFVVQAVTLRQTVIAKHLLGRANAVVLVFTAGVVPVASLAAGAIGQLTSIRLAVWIGVAIGLAVPAFVWPLRRLRGMPMPEITSSDNSLPLA